MIFFCFVFCYLALGRNFHSSVSLSGSFHHQAADWLSWFCSLLWLVSLFFVLAADWSDSKFVRPIKFSRLHLKISKKLYLRISPFLRLIFDCEPLFQKLRFWFEYSLECGIVFQLAEVLLQDQQENILSLPRLPDAVGSMLTGKLVPMAPNCMFWLLTVQCVLGSFSLTFFLTHREMNGPGFHISIRNSFKPQ